MKERRRHSARRHGRFSARNTRTPPVSAEKVPAEKIIPNDLNALSDEERTLAVHAVLEYRNRKIQAQEHQGTIALPAGIITVPVSIFSDAHISGLQALCRYLKEQRHCTFAEIARLLNRDQRTVWSSYHQSQSRQNQNNKKLSDTIVPTVADSDAYEIPISIFSQRTFSILESLVKYLHEVHMLRFVRIGEIIGQDQRVVWTVYNRVRKKRIQGAGQ